MAEFRAKRVCFADLELPICQLLKYDCREALGVPHRNFDNHYARIQGNIPEPLVVHFRWNVPREWSVRCGHKV